MKNKKKWLPVAAAIFIITIITTQADARQGWRENYNIGPKSGCGCNDKYNSLEQLDAETIQARRSFRNDTKMLRKELVQKQAERWAMMQQEKTDPKKLGELAGEIFELQSTLQQKAEKAGIQRENDRNCYTPGLEYRKGPFVNRDYLDRSMAGRPKRFGSRYKMIWF